MTETTARIRWRDDSDGGFVGTAGTAKALAFTIWPPDEDGEWLLVVFFTGLGGGCVTCREPAASPDELKRAAEDWLAGFVSSLGAIFPGGHPEGNAISAYGATGAGDGDGRHLLQYAVRLPDGTTTAYGDQSWVRAGLGARDHDGASTVVRDIWLSYGPWRAHETTSPEGS